MPPKNVSSPSPMTYPCSKCERSFSSAHALDGHGRAIGHLIPCATSGCTESFTSQEAFIQHVTSSVHKNARSNRLQSPTQQTYTSPVRREPEKTNQVTSAASNNTSKRNYTSGQSTTLDISSETPKAPISSPVGSTSKDICKGQLKVPRVSATYLAPLVQKTAHALNKGKQPSQSGLNTKLQEESSSSGLPPTDMLRPVRNVPGYGFYVPYDFNDCYLVATPRNGGVPWISPLIMDHGGKDHDFTLMLPTSHQQTQSTSLAYPGRCKFCGSIFTSWEPLKSHFNSSLCSTLRTHPTTTVTFVSPSQPLPKRSIANEKSTLDTTISEPRSGTASKAQAPRPQPKERSTIGTTIPEPHSDIAPKVLALRPRPKERPAIGTTIPEPQSSMASNAQVLRPQSKGRWSVIPEPQRTATLAALTSCCHSYTTLIENKYASGPGYSYVLGAGVELSLIPLPTPVRNPQVLRRNAVALDCEMVGVSNGESEIARISAIDCLTGEVLVDTMVKPTRTVIAWRTKFSGITRKAMATAVAERQALEGWPAARAELWKYIDADTVLIGQALQYDLKALRIQHWKVVDSAILAKDAVGAGVDRQWGLKALCDQLLGVEIQNGTKGLDSVEDAFAAREVVLWCIDHQDELEIWGRKQKEEDLRKKREQEMKKGKISQQSSSLGVRTKNSTKIKNEPERWEWVVTYGNMA
jgi:hypothetical protein